MTEYIERKVLDKALTVAAAADSDKRRRAWVEAIGIVHDIPAADVAPVAHAEWVFDEDGRIFRDILPIIVQSAVRSVRMARS